jgi:DNA-binding HxlR family transcriptional regulator
MDTIIMTEPRELLNPVTFAVSLLSGKWKLKILFKLQEGTKRFKELERELKGITPRMLVRELKELEEKRIVTRTVYPEIPSRVEYSLKEHAYSLLELIDTIEKWGIKHLENIKES